VEVPSPELCVVCPSCAIRAPRLPGPSQRRESSLSLSEIAIKTGLGKLELSWDAVRVAIEEWDMRILPYTGAHAQWMFRLPFHHSDPFDRQIIAQALCEQIPVVTCDKTFRKYEGLKIIW
jgi:PIN domain nuclease of toxin-antitoxin system